MSQTHTKIPTYCPMGARRLGTVLSHFNCWGESESIGSKFQMSPLTAVQNFHDETCILIKQVLRREKGVSIQPPKHHAYQAQNDHASRIFFPPSFHLTQTRPSRLAPLSQQPLPTSQFRPPCLSNRLLPGVHHAHTPIFGRRPCDPLRPRIPPPLHLSVCQIDSESQRCCS